MLKLLTIYWSILVLEMVFLFVNGKSISVSDILSNVVLLKVNLLHTSWYIRFYIEAMAILTLYHVCIKKKSAWMEILLTVCLTCIVYLFAPGNTFTHFEDIGPLAVITFMGPSLVLVLREIIYVFEKIKMGKMLLFISKYSTYYWLLHSIFHSGVKAIQAIAYFPYYMVLILIRVFILMIPFVVVLEKWNIGIWNFFSEKMRRV